MNNPAKSPQSRIGTGSSVVWHVLIMLMRCFYFTWAMGLFGSLVAISIFAKELGGYKTACMRREREGGRERERGRERE